MWDRARQRSPEHLPQTPIDGLLEILSFSGKFNLGLEQVIPGRARRIYQGTGPFTLEFKDLGTERRVYMQIDGEYFYANRPKLARIELSEISKEHIINILRKKK